MRHAFLLVFAFSLAGCGVPGRDNPHDPTNAPEAVIQVYLRKADGTDAAGTQGGQQTLFVFDASESFDAHGGGELSFAWDLTDARWDIGDVDDFETESNEGPAKLVTALPLTRTMLAHDGISTGVGLAPREVHLRVKTRDGAKAYASASVLLSNEAPVLELERLVTASPADLPPVFLDACGGVPPPECTSTDPDGDPITFSWEQVRGEPVALQPVGEDDARVTFQPAGDAPLEFKVTADDGVATTEAYVGVRFAPQVWVSTDLPARLHRVHPELAVRTAYRAPALTTFGSIVALAGSRGMIAVGQSDGTVLALDRDFSLVRFWTLPEPADELVVAPNSTGCARGPSGFHVLQSNGSISSQADAGAVRVLPADAGCWTAGSSLGRFTNDVWAPVASVGGLLDAALVPDGTVWVLTTAGTLHRLDEGASAPVAVSVPLVPQSIAAHPDGRSLLAIDVAGTPWKVASTGAADVDDDLPAIGVTDPVGGAVWEIDGPDLHHHRLRGTEWREEAPFVSAGDLGVSVFGLATADREDDSLLAVSGLAVVRIPSHLTRVRRVASFQQPPRVAADPSSGAVWVDAGEGLQRLVAGRIAGGADVTSSRLAVSLSNGEAWVDPFDGSYSLARIDRYGVEQERVSLDDRAVTSLDIAGSTMCVATDDYTGNGALVRVQLGGTPVVEPLAIDMDYTVSAAATPAGECWFSGLAGVGSPDHVVLVEPGETTAAISQIAPLPCGGRLLVDPRSGARLNPCANGGVDAGLAACSNGVCLNRWVISQQSVRLYDDSGLLETIPLDAGFAQSIEVAP